MMAASTGCFFPSRLGDKTPRESLTADLHLLANGQQFALSDHMTTWACLFQGTASIRDECPADSSLPSEMNGPRSSPPCDAEGTHMHDESIGWIAAIIIGGLAGWLAEQFMKSQMGLLMNIVLGIVGAAIASFVFSFLGVSFGGWIGYLIAGFIGACILIALARAFSGSYRRI